MASDGDNAPPVVEEAEQVGGKVLVSAIPCGSNSGGGSIPRPSPRSAEMVRVPSLSDRERYYFRHLVRRTRSLYEALRLLLAESAKDHHRWCRADLTAATMMKSGGADLWLNRDKRIVGPIPGIDIGDIFFFRVELCVVGLHGQLQAGIDYVSANRSDIGEPIATSIVSSHGYEDDDDNGDVIVYTGHGGKEGRTMRHSLPQQLESGNLALERSMAYGIEIRVIRGFNFEGSPSGKIYVYDGIYSVKDFWQDVGKSGFSVFKYKLARVAGQEEMGSSILKRAHSLRGSLLGASTTKRPPGYLCLDLSMGQENSPVAVFNDRDGDDYPLLFEYVSRPVYPFRFPTAFGGCRCVSGCFSGECPCAMMNGGRFAYDSSGILLMGRPLVIECGGSCHCTSACQNRVSQKGLGLHLEVFRSTETGWGLRSLDLIRAGAFVCEYSGVVLTKEQSELAANNGDGLLIYPCRFPNLWSEWGVVSDVVLDHAPPKLLPLPELSFSIDVSRRRNVACYLSHSHNPNLFVQPVLYDHYNESYPHLMVFAMETIPPMKELSIDYGMEGTLMLQLPPS